MEAIKGPFLCGHLLVLKGGLVSKNFLTFVTTLDIHAVAGVFFLRSQFDHSFKGHNQHFKQYPGMNWQPI